MNKILVAFFLFSVSLFFSQSSLKVYDAEKHTPIAEAKVYCKDSFLGETNDKGMLVFSAKCTKIEVIADGFYSGKVLVDNVMELGLEKDNAKTSEIEGVVLSDRSDPRALAILDKVFRRFKENSPNALESYSYKSYEKMSIDIDEDSIKEYSRFVDARKDSLSKMSNREFSQTDKAKKDSLQGEQFMNVVKNSQFFLWERATQFLFSKKYGEKINVLDNRISGLKEPIYEMLTLRSNRNKVPKEILPENRTLYRFYLTDSLEIDGRDNFVIRFRQIDYVSTQNKRKYNGYIYIDKESYAIKKIESNSKKISEGNITSIWTPIEKKWFLKSENLKIKMGSTDFSTVDKKENETPEERKKRLSKIKKFGNYAYIKSNYFDFQTPVDLEVSQFQGYTMNVQNTDGSLLEKYRTDSLSQRESMTYVKIDSLGKKYKLDRMAKVLSGLLRGKITVGFLDIDPLQSKYSRYEGIRVGLGFKLNEKFNRYISPDVYFGYGFRDEAWKYLAGLDIRTNLDRNSFFRVEYFDEVAASGRFNQNGWNPVMRYMNSGMDIQNDKYYKYKGLRLAYEADISNSLTINLSAKKQSEEAGFDYEFMNQSGKFNNFSSLATLKFSPNSRNIMTPSGKYTYDQNFPEVYFNYEQGYKTLGGDFNYSRFDVLYTHQFRTILGITGTRFYGGYFMGKAPIWHTFEMGGLDSSNDDGVFSHFNLTTYLGFATMPAGLYFNDKFGGYYFTHRIPWYFKSFGKNTSSFDLVYKGIVGEMKNREYHNFEFESLNHLYQEVGLEYNNFLSTQFNLGLFYRVGNYATKSFTDNFAIQLKLKILGF